MIPHTLFLSATLESYKENNNNDENDEFLDQEYRIEDRSITVMEEGEGKLPMNNGGSDRWILEGGEWGTHDNGDDKKI